MPKSTYKYVDGKLILVEGDDVLKDYKKTKEPAKVYKKAVNKLNNGWHIIYICYYTNISNTKQENEIWNLKETKKH